MKNIRYIVLLCACYTLQVSAQTNTFPATGNVGIGTTTPTTLFQVNGGTAQFGGAVNYARFLIDGDLTLTGTADYLVGGDRYAFRYSGNQNFGLLFSSSNSRYEFRDGSASPVMWITGGGNIYAKNRLHIGSQANPTASLEITPSNALAVKINPYGVSPGNTGEMRMLELAANGNQFVGFKAPNSITTSRVYTLPTNDGTSGQILSTNGAGELSWVSDANSLYTAGSGLSVFGNIFSNTAPDQVVTLLSGGIISISGTYPNFTISAVESDPIFNASPAAGIIAGDITNWNAAHGWGDHADAGYLTSFTETDPIYNASPAFDIAAIDISNWNDAYNWGDHADAGYLTSFTETDPLYNASIAADISGADTANWNDAYSWGDHALEGYLTSFTETDPLWLASPSSGITSGDIINWSDAYGWGDHAEAGYLTSFTETDPIFIASPAFDIAALDMSNWNAAYGWGDHAEAGYLTSYTETDPLFNASLAADISATDTSNWNAAYGWGDHALEGYLTYYTETDPIFDASTASDITAEDIDTWNAAYGWGDHALEGYLTSYTETDPFYNASIAADIIGTDTSNWNAAYNWGDHAEAGYLTSFTETDPQVSLFITNRIPKWNGTTLVDGLIYDDGLKIGIGTITPNFTLDVSGDASFNGVRVGMGNGNVPTNTAVGLNALLNNTDGSWNTALGEQALLSNTIGYNNAALGRHTLMHQVSGYNNTALGASALWQMNGGNNNLAAGAGSMLVNTSGSANTVIGTSALYNNSTGSSNSVLGFETGFNNNGSGNVFLGHQAGYNEPGSNKLYIANSGGTPLIYGDFTSAQIGLGTITPEAKLDVRGNAKFGNNGEIYIYTWDYVERMGFDYNPYNNDFNMRHPFGGRLLQTISATSGSWGVENTNGTELVRVTANGNMGIGTTSPAYKLDVIGDVSLNGIRVGHGNGNIGSNTIVGYNALYSNTTGSYNTVSGYSALSGNITGNNNTASGFYALAWSTTGSNNTASGYYALSNNTTGNYNTAYGSNSLQTNTTGTNNTAIGFGADVSSAGLNNATAIGSGAIVSSSNSLVLGNNANVGIGTSVPVSKLHIVGGITIADGTEGVGKVLISDASGLASWQEVTVSEADPQVSSTNTNMVPKWNGSALTDGIIYDDGVNVGIGTNSPTYKLQVNAAALINGIIIGQGAGMGGANVVVGSASMISNVSGHDNTTLGHTTLMSNTTGNNNVAIGSMSMYGNIDGFDNTAIGYSALSYGEDGNYNTAVGSSTLSYSNGTSNSAFGYRALSISGSAYNNTAIGAQSLENNQTGNNNSTLGCSALWKNTSGTGNTAAGLSALVENTQGNYNTAIGLGALITNVTGANNAAIGYLADVGSSNLINATAVGSIAIVDASNKVRIGNTSVTSIGGQVSWTNFSDERMKKDIRNDVPGLEFINQLKPVTYHIDLTKQNELMGMADTMQWDGKYDIENINFTGFLAQDVDEAAQRIGYDFSGIDKTGSIMGLRYSDFVVPLTKAAQELDATNQEQNAEIAVLQETITALQQQISDLTDMLNTGTTNDGAAAITLGEGSNTAMLGQNIPNPYDQSTLIPFRIPKNCKDASIMITDPIVGRVITVIPISCSETHIVFEAGELPSGAYTYSLFVDGQLIGTKEMILTR